MGMRGRTRGGMWIQRGSLSHCWFLQQVSLLDCMLTINWNTVVATVLELLKDGRGLVRHGPNLVQPIQRVGHRQMVG